MIIDLNCDLGEGSGQDAELLHWVTTANVCCGAYAGDAATSAATMQLAKERGVRVGAHLGYADRQHFGRREQTLPSDQLFAECVRQVDELTKIAQSCGMRLTHLKPHGALYNQACRDHDIAKVIAAVAVHFRLPILGLPNSEMERAALNQVKFIREGFADRRYRADGSLTPRSEPGAFIKDAGEAADQVERLCVEQGVQSICIHGDNPDALQLVCDLRRLLTDRGHLVQPFA